VIYGRGTFKTSWKDNIKHLKQRFCVIQCIYCSSFVRKITIENWPLADRFSLLSPLGIWGIGIGLSTRPLLGSVVQLSRNFNVGPCLNMSNGSQSLMSATVSQELCFLGLDLTLVCTSCKPNSYSPSVNRHRLCLSYTVSSEPYCFTSSPLTFIIPVDDLRRFWAGSARHGL